MSEQVDNAVKYAMPIIRKLFPILAQIKATEELKEKLEKADVPNDAFCRHIAQLQQDVLRARLERLNQEIQDVLVEYGVAPAATLESAQRRCEQTRCD